VKENVIILIDAYNLLKQINLSRDVSQKERARFITLMGRYSNKKRHHIIVVFDAGPYEWLHKERIHGVHVVYSGLHASADDYIKHYIADHQESDILLVSDDRDLNVYAARAHLPSISPRDFYILVQEAMQAPASSQPQIEQAATKMTEESQTEIDILMQEASRTVSIKKDDTSHITHAGFNHGKKLSKEERKLLQKLKKL
jgi:predicted RNA-binding protein with PIN domain